MNAVDVAKNMRIDQNVTFRVIDKTNGNVVQSYTGHNAITNSMLTGIAHFLVGDGVINDNGDILSLYIPRYISLGTMGLITQDSDYFGLPTGLGVGSLADSEEERFTKYMNQTPGFGADGYDANNNNNRPYLGLGKQFDKSYGAIDSELISKSFPRFPISYRVIVPESETSLDETIEIIFSAMVSTGALAQFRDPDKNYIYITEAGLWSKKDYVEDSENNGLLAGFRIIPPDARNHDMTIEENRNILKQQILRVGINQVVQVIWKVQICSISQLDGSEYQNSLQWIIDGLSQVVSLQD